MTYEQTLEQFVFALNSNAYMNMCTCDDMTNVIKALQKRIPRQIVSDGNDESDWVYCPCCAEILGVNEGAYNSFYENNWRPIYCHKCGQAIIWK